MVNILVIFLVFILSLKPPVDLDLGWHLRYGQYFFQTGRVLKDNILSYIWPNYHWVQASWGYDLLVYQLFTRFGLASFSIAGAVLTVLIFFLITRSISRFSFFQYFFLAAVFLTQAVPLYATGLRSQIPSALMFTLTLLVAIQAVEKNKPKLLFLLPVLFLIWANFHGGFSLGLILLFLYGAGFFILYLLRKFKNAKVLSFFGLSLIASAATPFINPWGFRIYEETFKHSSNLNLNLITEWTPLYQFNTVAFFISVICFLFTAVILITVKKMQSLPYLFMLLAVTYLGFSAIRFLILFAILITVILAQNLTKIVFNPPKLFRYFLDTFLVVALLADIFFFNLYLSLPPANLLTYSWTDYCNFMHDCSEEITQIMLKNPPSGHGFHPYNYGGYLAWRVPQVQTFLDPRMPSWEDEAGHTPPIQEGDAVFTKQNPLVFEKFNSLYHFNWAIIPTGTAASAYLDSLSQLGLWQKLYGDNWYNYYRKIK